MVRGSFLFCLALIFSFPAFAQKEANIWMFGSQCGLDFNSGAPSAISGGSISTNEGCATVCNRHGQLLFYTDGVTVWNRSHSSMDNGTGLNGHSSSTQSAVVVPFVGDTSKYYLFTAPAVEQGGTYGLQYNIVDMSANSGLGKVTTKNQRLKPYAAEKLTAAKHANGKDYWVVTHTVSSDSFYAYPITSSGIGTPVASKVGITHSSGEGQLKISPNGKKLAAATWSEGVCEIFDFDNKTGKISKPVRIPVGTVVYGAEFSPDGSKLYTSEYFTTMLRQYDLSSGDSSKMISPTFSTATASSRSGMLQLAPDGKIYAAVSGMGYLSVIQYPDSLGSACGFKSNGVSLNGTCALGLPTFLQSVFAEETPADTILVTTPCFGDDAFAELKNDPGMDSVLWLAESPTNKQLKGKGLDLTFNANEAGTWQISAAFYQGGTNVKNLSQTMIIAAAPAPNLGPDTSLCPAYKIKVSPGTFDEYLWSDGSTANSLDVTEAGTYWVKVKKGACFATDTVRVGSKARAQSSLQDSAWLCPGKSVYVDAGTAYSGQEYLWKDDGSMKPYRTITQAGVYTVRIISPSRCDTLFDTIRVIARPTYVLDLGRDTSLCAGQNLTLNIGHIHDALSINWSTGATDSSIQVSAAGTYSVTVKTLCGDLTDSIRVIYQSAPVLDLPDDTTLCEGQKWTISLNGPEYGQVYWQDTIPARTYYITTAGTYRVKATNNCGTAQKEFRVKYLQKPKVDLGRDTTLCFGTTLVLKASWPDAQVSWNDQSNDTFMVVTSPGKYSVMVTNACGTATDDIQVNFAPSRTLDLGRDTMICLEDSLVLSPKMNPGTDFLWQDGSKGNAFVVKEAGTYSLRTQDACGAQEDSVKVTFEDCHCYLYMPTAFSPNADGANDSIKPSGCPTISYHFQIFNRWGERVFQTEDIKEAWDGKFRSGDAPEGMYLYVVEARGINRKYYSQSARFYLLR